MGSRDMKNQYANNLVNKGRIILTDDKDDKQ